MKDPNKSNSFLFSLYQKYVKKQEQMDIGDKQVSVSRELISETMQEIKEAVIPPEKTFLQPLHELYLYYLKTNRFQGEGMDLLSFEEWCLAPVKALPDYAAKESGIASFEKRLCAEAVQLLYQFTAENEMEISDQGVLAAQESNGEGAEDDKTKQAEEIPEPQPHDAVCWAYTTSDRMAAFLFAIPPLDGGKPLDRDCIDDCLKRESITYGLEESRLEQMVENQAYLQIFQVAVGTLPVSGKDGIVIPQIDCSSEIQIRQNEQGVSDFKNLNSIRCAAKDQVICVIVPPEKGIPGKTVKGEELRAQDGKPAPDPRGKHTVLSEDKTRLLAGLDGQITLRNGRYEMAPVLIVDSNVDYGVGNISFSGDVIINGDVCNGFTVKAEGSITVHGMVESADIIAGGDVMMSKGMNGNFNGYIDAKGSVKTSFLENCTVYAEGPLYASSIVNSKIFCGSSVYVLEKHGAIIGGTITAYKSVEAKVIGSQSRRETNLILGELPRMSEKKTQAEAELKTVRELLEKLNKNVTYLSEIKATLPPEKLEIFNQLRLQQTLYESRKTELIELLAEIASSKHDFRECKVKCGKIFPPTKISIGPEALLVNDTTTRCTIYLTTGGIVVGMI